MPLANNFHNYKIKKWQQLKDYSMCPLKIQYFLCKLFKNIKVI